MSEFYATARPEGAPLRATKDVDCISTRQPWGPQEQTLARLCAEGASVRKKRWWRSKDRGHMAAALGTMHQSPEEPWTVARLADEVGRSRFGFAARFAALVGETPLAH